MNTPGSISISFTAEQNLQIEEWNRRIENLTEECRKAEEVRKGLDTSIETVSKHNAYLEERARSLELDIDNLEKMKKELEASVSGSARALEDHAKETAAHVAHFESLRTQHDAREKALIERQDAVTTHEKAVNAREQEVLEKQRLVENAHDAFLKATESVIWK